MADRILTTIACAALSLVLFAASANAGNLLSGSEVKSLLSGKTLAGSAGETIKFEKTYNADGTYILIFADGGKREGKWWIDGDQYCQERGEYKECFAIEKDEESGLYHMVDEEGAILTTIHPQ